MDEFKRNQIPKFGNWDYSDGLPITQYFESARQAGLLRYSSGEQDLYVGGDLYGRDLKKPTITVVPRRKTHGVGNKVQTKTAEKRYPHVKEPKKQGRVYDVTEPARKTHQQTAAAAATVAAPPPRRPKAVDEDLYKIPPELLYANTKRKKMFGGFFSRCLVPTCDA